MNIEALNLTQLIYEQVHAQTRPVHRLIFAQIEDDLAAMGF